MSDNEKLFGMGVPSSVRGILTPMYTKAYTYNKKIGLCLSEIQI